MSGRFLINVKGMQCPTPLTVVSNELAKMSDGAEFEIVTDDFICFMMLQRFLRILNIKVKEAVQLDDGTYRIVGVKATS
ncbi:sulfurtransferase TusA family protein [Vulcanisaeta thermophila]|uniref:sulfurtransferase TusA family protein n=1 Tax=Vulcanisaeta thermophila TaxID=867917 RepID=UPI0008538D08|nr:sulfurtransferase TusA family protein [Vulcanisaeta thermophila]